MTISPSACALAPATTKARLRLTMASSALMLLTACAPGGLSNLDWDLRSNGGSTAESARLATARAPVADGNGILSYPNYQLAQAQRGDNVMTVASRLGISPAELARANALQPNDPLREGELLILPKRVAATPQPLVSQPYTAAQNTAPLDITSRASSALDRVETTALPPIASASPSAVQSNPTPFAIVKEVPGGGQEPVRHIVKRGESASIVARQYNVSAKSLAEWNKLDAQMTLREGQTLIIPVATGQPPKQAAVTTSPGQGTTTPVPPSASKPLPDEKTQPAAQVAKATPASPDLGASRTTSAAKLAMPVSGSIIRGYDKKSNQGVDISAAAGSAVKAAEAGTVAAITKDTEQTQIVVIRHADNLLTVYAGVDALKIKKGDKVSRGQQIGAVRAASTPFLHFEVRKGVDSLDPMSYLK